MSILGVLGKMFAPVGILAAVTILRTEAAKQRIKDSNNTGRDDLKATYYDSVVMGIEAFASSDDPKTLLKVGKSLVATGNQMINEAESQVIIEASIKEIGEKQL